MYDLIFTTKIYTLISALILVYLSCVTVGSGKMFLQTLMFVPAPAFASGFYFITLISKPELNSFDLCAGFAFELTILVLLIKLLSSIKDSITSVSSDLSARILKYLALLQFIIFLPNLSAEGFGIFSDGNRLEYLAKNSLAKYFTYSGILISILQATFLASLFSVRGYFGKLGLAIIALNFALSVLVGSKGGVFLWLLTIAALINYKKIEISIFKSIIFLFITLMSIIYSSIIISNFIGIEFYDFVELAFNRFFLVNDARALAFDLRNSETSELSFIVESFRSISSLLGFIPKNLPLGVVLYEDGLSNYSGSGANASFMALATYYSTPGFTSVIAFVGIIGALSVFLLDLIFKKIFRDKSRQIFVTSVLFTTLLTYSQDFLAFQLLLPIVAIFFTILLYFKKI